MAPLRLAFVPEHFSTPLHFASTYFSLPCTLHPFPAGTGAMISALRAGEIDIAIGLTEGWIAGLGTKPTGEKLAGYKPVGTYVSTPLCWAIVTGAERTEITTIRDLSGRICGISRFGSGSHVMASVLHQKSALSQPFTYLPLENFANLRAGVAHIAESARNTDFFMWETFTCSRYFSSGYDGKDKIKKIGEIYTPWPSWLVVASDNLLESDGGLEQVKDVLSKIGQGVNHFKENPDEAVKYISTELDYSEDDARAWLKTVKFPNHINGVSDEILRSTIDVLKTAGVLADADTDAELMSMKI